MILFSTPTALLLLAAGIPLLLWIGWPRVRLRRLRDSLSLTVRVLLFTLVVLALAGMQVPRGTDRLAVVFLVDRSDSISAAGQQAQEDYLTQALAAMNPGDEAAIVVYGGDAVVERPMSPGSDFTPIRSTPVSGNTDLAEAIGLGLALFPEDAAQRMVILSDGAQTVGDALQAADRAAATGVEISIVPLVREAAPEVRVSEVRAPETVGAGQQFDISFTVSADEATTAAVTVLAGGEVIRRENLALQPGDNNYALTLEAGEGGFRDFRVQIEPPPGEDVFVQNNQLSGFSRVVGPPRVLLVSRTEEESSFIADALTALGYTIDRTTPDALPDGVATYVGYDSVVLANIPATALTQRRMESLRSYVRDLGGGLVAIGGPEAFAAGGYFDTPLEEMLPVEMQIRDQQRLPQLTICYVIDRSGSMSIIGPSGVANLELAKEAIIRSIEFLQPTDRACVIGFDTDGQLIAPVQPVQDRLALQSLVGSLRPGGGTDILAGYRLAADELRGNSSGRNHIILLTDGGAVPTGLLELSSSLYLESDITTSVIAIGGGPDFLQQMAEAGGGNYHEVTLVETIPTIFTQETVLATRSYILEQSFVPTLFTNSPIMSGITTMPRLYGYVASAPKDTAQVILRGSEPYLDPILAQWQYGLGRTIAFTSDATSRWGRDWVRWGDFARFWGQAVEWTITRDALSNMESQVRMTGETAAVAVDARATDGTFLNGATLSANVVPPSGEPFTVPVRQIAPGRYQADFQPTDEGAYLIHMFGEGENGEEVSQTTGWVMSYSPEYRNAKSQEGAVLLVRMASLTGGDVLSTTPEAVFERNLQARTGYTPAWPALLLAAALLLPVDIALRRLVITRRDVQRARAAVLSGSQPSAETAERMSALRSAKARADQAREEQAAQAAAGAPRPAPPPPAARPGTGGPPPGSVPPAAPAPPASPAPPQGNLAGELLKRRKTRD